MSFFKKVAALCLSAVGFGQAINIAHYGGPSLPNSFLDYAKGAGYTHVLWQLPAFNPADWAGANGYYTGGTSGTLYTLLKGGYESAKAKGLCLIPSASLGARWPAQKWELTNSNIVLNRDTSSGGISITPAFAPEPNGIDRSYNQYLMVVNSAYEDAGTQAVCGSVKFIHMGYDEPYSQGYLGSTGYTKLMIARGSPSDQNYIASNGNNASAYYKLYASSIKRRVNQAQVILGATVQVLMWADALDPEHHGGLYHWAWTSGGGANSILLKPMYALSGSPDIMDVSANLILMPWQYEPNKGWGGAYNAETTLDRFKMFGMRFIPQSGYGATTGHSGFHSSAYLDNLAKGNRMMHRWVNAARLPKYNGYMLGFAGSVWGDPDYFAPQDRYWNNGHNVGWPRNGEFYMQPKLAKAARFYPEKVDLLSVWNCADFYCGYMYDPRDGSVGSVTQLGYNDPGALFTGNVHGVGDREGAPWPNDVADRMDDVVSATEYSSMLTLRSWQADEAGNLSQRSWQNFMMPGGSTIKYLKGDIDGDGRIDIFHLYNSSSPNFGLRVYRSRGKLDGYGFQQTYQSHNRGDLNGHLEFLTGDMNGDGMTDLYQFKQYGILEVVVYGSRGAPPITMPFRRITLSNSSQFNRIRFFVEDFDGDGDTDIYNLRNNAGRLQIDTYRTNGSMYGDLGGTYTLFASNPDIGGAGNASDYFPGDIDGDGKTDLFFIWNNGGNLAIGLKKATGTSAGFVASQAYHGTKPFLSGSTFRAADIDGDGKTDVIEFKDTGSHYRIRTFKSTGTTLVPYSEVYNPRGGAAVHVLTMDTEGE